MRGRCPGRKPRRTFPREDLSPVSGYGYRGDHRPDDKIHGYRNPRPTESEILASTRTGAPLPRAFSIVQNLSRRRRVTRGDDDKLIRWNLDEEIKKEMKIQFEGVVEESQELERRETRYRCNINRRYPAGEGEDSQHMPSRYRRVPKRRQMFDLLDTT
ncbi:hypothetical protein RUM44_007310 [Polyplax serrata]|uniref:Uncharacterized protein n=1 Tax=Polyplax serrata TaxID=468196 RepID=A0ABR1B1Z2_POLSC